MRNSSRAARSDSSLDVWPVFGDTILALLLVLLLLFVFQVGANIRISSGLTLAQRVSEDQVRMKEIVTRIQAHHGGISISDPDGTAQEITLGSEVLFESGSDRLSPSGTALLTELVREIATADVRTLKEITVKGHTDDIAIRTSRFTSNWELSTARASRVVRALSGEGAAAGIDPRKVTLVAAGYGEFSPVSRQNKAQNRRIEIRLVYTNHNS